MCAATCMEWQIQLVHFTSLSYNKYIFNYLLDGHSIKSKTANKRSMNSIQQKMWKLFAKTHLIVNVQ